MLDIKVLERPTTPEEAVKAFAEGSGSALFLAGGTILVPAASPNLDRLVDLADTGLDYVREDAGEAGPEIAVGATTRIARLATDPLLKGLAQGLLADAARAVATHTVRNRATVGGNLVAAGYPTDLPTAFLALGASVVVLRGGSRRRVGIGELYDRRSETFRKGDLIVEVRVPLADPKRRGAFEKIGRKRIDVPIVNCAVSLELIGGRIRGPRLALGGIGASPVRLRPAEDLLEDSGASADMFAEASALAVRGIEPRSDHRASGEYRRKVAGVLLRRALHRAAETGQE
jgi:carbon-monoxide dehydrogenase medium subunit